MKINKGDWVQVYNVLLKPEERAPQVPEDTKKVPFEMRVNGYAQKNAEIGETISIKTLSGRIVEGRLVRRFPSYELSFGNHVQEVSQISQGLKTFLFGGNNCG